jgi:hypothetical protein
VITLGTVSYTQAQLLPILDQPAKGNGLVTLAHQLVAAKLNVAHGADPADAAQAISDADAMIGRPGHTTTWQRLFATGPNQ